MSALRTLVKALHFVLCSVCSAYLLVFEFTNNVSTADILKDHELPLKKQKLNEYLNHVPYNLQHTTCIQQIYASLDPVYIHQCLQEFSSANRHLSAFKPVAQSIKEAKIRQANALGRYTTDPPLLQNPERVVPLSESERFERTYQPNVALAPPTPKKHRYGRGSECSVIKTEVSSPLKLGPGIQETEVVTESHVEEKDVTKTAVPVVQSLSTISKYNPEIELSTDTEDSASESSERHLDLNKIEEVLKIVDTNTRDRVLEFVRSITKDHDRLVQENSIKDNKISELELRNSELLKQLSELRANSGEITAKNIAENCSDNPTDCKKEIVNSSSGIISIDSLPIETKSNDAQKSVIATLGEQKEGIIKTVPE